MSIKESVIDGKIVKSHVPKVLKLLDRYVDSLLYTYLEVNEAYDKLGRLRHDYSEAELEPEDATEIFLLGVQICANRRELLYLYAYDLYEFYYGKDGKLQSEPDEYFYHQFPLDVEKFEQVRPPAEKLRALLDHKIALGEEFCNYIKEADSAFRQCLKL